MPGQKWCRVCKTEYARDWRAGTIQMQLTPGERAMLLHWRAVAAACDCEPEKKTTGGEL